MPSKNPAQRLREIIDNIDAIQVFTQDLDRKSFAADRKTVYAVVRALEIISEASRRLPENLKQQYPEVDWIAMAAAGNIYRHEYAEVDETLVWHTRTHGLAELRRIAVVELSRLEEHPLE